MVQLPLRGSKETVNVNPTKIIALGLNYRDHIAESQSVKAGFTSDLPEGARSFRQNSERADRPR